MEERKTVNEIIDDYWSDRIIKERICDNSQNGIIQTFSIIEELLGNLNLYRTAEALRDVKNTV